ncbi:MAG: chorismate synthase, partial [Clostridia bacterium]|nr:chorismate synthase [Clostridia bacterium]
MRVTTAGESHGKALVAIIEGMPAGLQLDISAIDKQLALRQSGYGRGARQKLESDKVEILSGVRNGVTLGSPITLAVYNRDYENWKAYMAPEGCDTQARKVTRVRPGHADLTGLKKFGGEDARNILERASARETAVRVAAGTVCRQYLSALGVEVAGFVRSVGSVKDEGAYSFDNIK